MTPGLADSNAIASAALTAVSKNTQCASAPSWLDLSLGGGKVVCIDEGFTGPNGTIFTLTADAAGKLSAIHSSLTISGPVATKFYNNNTAVALAHYAGSAISTFKVSADGAYTPLQNFTYPGDNHGPKPQQDKAHVHEAILDPTGQYLVFPDLGLDRVHVYCIDPSTGNITPHEDLKSPSGYGPRHATFWSSSGSSGNGTTYLFVIHELVNKIISYQVGYLEAGGLTFTQVDEVSTYGNKTAPEGAAAAEIVMSPDNKFVIASNRNNTIAMVPNPDPSNSTEIGSDSIVTFKPSCEGKLNFVQLVPSGGSFPRHFSTNKDGSMIAVANQNTNNVDVYARDLESGMIGNKVASAFGIGPGALTNVQWLED
ncbi:putative isomerase YbhE [Trematosphaeria pertusa]|uniref:Putative isomerase YbhE n=1 Tax=Trematosphaeria pertusa TaxID=390896 RepID=A0A6A6HVX0_9PLEO|nr:putative isomerase YbhE [Trematosphaeria pertusa]KAF2241703.1 putative isomerase YbhE [Trematosphaeria pertusa]